MITTSDRTTPTRTVLVELFTSQGCSSCPPADALLGRLPELGFAADQVIALSYHVTYWDDLGWADPFGSPRHDARQLGYARGVPGHDPDRSMRGPYTPQMIVDGRVHFPGTLADVALQQISRARSRPTTLVLTPTAALRGEGDARSVDVTVLSEFTEATESELGLFVALAQRSARTEVPRGENTGKQLREYDVVLELVGPLPLRSETQAKLRAPKSLRPDELELVVFAQDLGSLAIAAAARAALAG